MQRPAYSSANSQQGKLAAGRRRPAEQIGAQAQVALIHAEPCQSQPEAGRNQRCERAGPALAKELCRKSILGIAYETVEGVDGQFPLLKPMSQIAGRLSIQIGAYFLQSQLGGSGMLLGGIPGTELRL